MGPVLLAAEALARTLGSRLELAGNLWREVVVPRPPGREEAGTDGPMVH